MRLTDEVINQRFGRPANTGGAEEESVAITMHDIAEAFITFVNHLNEIVPDSNARAKALMFTELESARMWAQKATEDQLFLNICTDPKCWGEEGNPHPHGEACAKYCSCRQIRYV